MPATIRGIVFNDANRNSHYDFGDTGISNVSVCLLDTTSTYTTTTTSSEGIYTFTNINVAGVYTVYETVTTQAEYPPTFFPQPIGYNQSTTQRVQTIEITLKDITENSTLTINFGHEIDTNNEDDYLEIQPLALTCNATSIQFVYDGARTSYINIDLVTGNYVDTGYVRTSGGADLQINAIGYNRIDNLLYGWTATSDRVVRINENRVATILAAIPNLPTTNQYNVGDIDANGYLYLYEFQTTRFYVVDVNSSRGTYLRLVDPNNNFQLETSNYGVAISSLSINDWVFSNTDGQIYSVQRNGQAVRVNRNNGTVTGLTTTGLPSLIGSGSYYGATFSISDGRIYAIDNLSGNIYRVTISGNNATGELFSKTMISSGNDGASCASASLPIDFGDCPDTTTIPFTSYHNYRSTLAKDGPRHSITTLLVFGTGATAETNALQNPTATGDSLDDGIGVLPLPTIAASATSYVLPITVTNNLGSVANIYAWLDFNNNGVFEGNEATTRTVSSIPSGTQKLTLTFNKPANTTILGGLNFIRMRITTDVLINANSANLTLEDTRSYGAASNGEVEDHPLYITNIMITDPRKTVDKSYANIGDTIKYTLTIPNQGSTDMVNVRIIDTIPTGSAFVSNSLTLNSITIPGATPMPPSGYNLGTIPFGQLYTVTFQVLVQTIPSTNNLVNRFQIFYNYLQNVQTVTTVPGTATSNTTPATTISNARIVMTKSASSNYADIGSTITYIIKLNNTGNTSATNVVFRDTIPSGTTFVNGSFTINTTTISGSPTLPGLNIGTIPVGITTVSFKVTVNTIPTQNPIPNSATTTFNYTVDPSTPNGGSGGGNSNINYVTITSARLSLTKTSDVNYAGIGNVITYILSLKNTGNTMATNVVVIDTIPNGTTFIDGSFTINTTTISGSPHPPGINIGTVPVGVTTVSFKVTVTTIPTINPIQNSAATTFKYTVDPTTPNGGSGGGNSNINYVTVSSASLSMLKTSSPYYADIGTTITYTILLNNTGNVSATSVVFRDTIPTGTTFINGSLTVNTTTIAGSPTPPGINIGTVPVGITTVSFKVTVNTLPTLNPIPNSATTTFSFTINPSIPNGGSGNANSNTAYNQVNRSILVLIKSVDKKYATCSEKLKYTFMITNTGNVSATNIVFKDTIPNGTQYVSNSFTLDGVTISGADPTIGVNLNTISVGATSTLTFQVKVLC